MTLYKKLQFLLGNTTFFSSPPQYFRLMMNETDLLRTDFMAREAHTGQAATEKAFSHYYCAKLQGGIGG